MSEKGRNDCLRAAGVLRTTSLDVVISSPLRRTCRARCEERCFGTMEGRTWEEVQGSDPPLLFIEAGDDLHPVNPPGGEPLEDVWQRAKRFWNLVFRDYAGLQALVVSHGVFLQMFHGVLRGSTCIESLAKYRRTSRSPRSSSPDAGWSQKTSFVPMTPAAAASS